MDIEVRKTVICVEEISHEGGPKLAAPLRVGWAAVVIKKPLCGGVMLKTLPR